MLDDLTYNARADMSNRPIMEDTALYPSQYTVNEGGFWYDFPDGIAVSCDVLDRVGHSRLDIPDSSGLLSIHALAFDAAGQRVEWDALNGYR